jgi:putative chitinase
LAREKEKLNESAELRKFQLDITKLLLEHAGEVVSAEDSMIDYYRSVAFSLLPNEYRDPIIKQLATNAPSDHAKAHWAGIAVFGRLNIALHQNDDKQAISTLKVISADFISDRIGPLHEPSSRERITELFNAMQDAGIKNPASIINFFAYVFHTSRAFSELAENLNYTSQGLLTTWPSRFNTDTAAEFAHQPEKIANLVYGGRLGNSQPDDGWRYRGRGYTQITGRSQYANISTCASANLVDNPDLVLTDRQIAAKAAVCDFELSGSLPFAAQDDLAGVASHMNGGYIGLVEMQIWKQKMVPGSENVTSDLPSTNTVSRNGN